MNIKLRGPAFHSQLISPSTRRRCAVYLIASLATLLASTAARAAFHLWQIREVYTDSSGTLQFIELFCPSSGQTFLSGQQIRVTDPGGTMTHTFTLTNNTSATLNHALLLGTTGADAAGAPTPDYFIPSNFLFPGGGTISFFGANSGAYTALPTNGVLSRTWGDGEAANTPQNFAGQTGTVVPAVNLPPSISITNPPDNTLFAAPGTVPVGVSASDSDGSVANVQLLTNGVPAATSTLAPFGITLSNLAAGTYTLRARAQDNQGLSATSAPVIVRIADRPTLLVQPGSGGPIQFQFNSATGISYIVERASGLTGFSPVATNPGSGGMLQYSETDGSVAQRAYRVRLR